MQLWERERLLPPPKSVFVAYENQPELFFILERLDVCQILAESTFRKLWEEAAITNTQSLLAEILVCGDLIVGNIVPVLPLLGDLEVQFLCYYFC